MQNFELFLTKLHSLTKLMEVNALSPVDIIGNKPSFFNFCKNFFVWVFILFWNKICTNNTN